MSVLAKLAPDRRREQRRSGKESALIAASIVFERDERGVLRSLERRRQVRRRQDLSSRLAHLQELSASP